MFKLFSKPAWQSKSAQDRISALQDLHSDNAEDQAIILKLCQDANIKVAVAAVERLNELDLLANIMRNHSDSGVSKHAQKRIAQLVQSELFADIAHARQTAEALPELQDIMACYCANKELRHELIDNMPDGKLLIALNGTPYKQSKAYIVDSLKNLATIEQARKELRGKDKNAERLLKQKQDKLRQQQQATETFNNDVERAIAEMSKLAQQEWRPELQLQCLSVNQLWQRLSESDLANTLLSEERSQKYHQAYRQIQETIDKALATEQAAKQQDSLLSELSALLQAARKVDANQLSEQLTTFSTQLRELDASWQLTLKSNSPSAEQEKEYVQTNKRITDWIDVAQQLSDCAKLSEASIPKNLDTKSKLYQQLCEAQSEHQKSLSAEQKAYQTHVDQLHKKVGGIFSALRAGELKRAKGTYHRVESQLEKLDEKDQGALSKRLNDAKEKLDELGDWRDFATTPKFQELCEQMEALQTVEQHPRDRAQSVKALREEWKKLGNSAAAQENWERFNSAAELAYQPCIEYFEKREQQRNSNLEKRQHILNDLQSLLGSRDWSEDELDNEQWKETQRKFQSLRSRWENHKDVERKANKPLQDEFEASKNEMEQRLTREHQRNITAKESLVNRAEALAEQEADPTNLQQLKQLQFSWKLIGITPRDEDQALWLRFKAAGDLTHNKIRELRDGERKVENEKIDAVRDIINAFAKLSAQEADDKTVAELQSQFDAGMANIQHQPEKLLERLQQDFRRAGEKLEEKRSALVNNHRQQELDKLKALAALCLRVEAGESTENIAEEWDAVELSESQWLKQITARRDAAGKNPEAATQARKLVCIQLEIQHDIPSPEADKSLRMEYQLEQLKNVGIGQLALEDAAEFEQKEIEWLCMPGAIATEAEALDKRFYSALNAGQNK